MRILIIAAIFLATGCAVHQPVSQDWRLSNRENGHVLIPPGVAAAKAGFALDVRAGSGKCPPAIRAHGKRVVVTVDADSMAKHPAGWLKSWAGELESQGCIGRGEASIFAESLPLDPNVGFHLRYADDIETPVRLQVVSPILRGDAAPEAPLEVSGSGNSLTVTTKAPVNQIGYETAVYAVQPKASGVGFSIAPLYADRHVQQEVEHVGQPAVNHLQFPPAAAFYRLFFKSDQTDFTALVIAGSTRAELEKNVSSCDPSDRMCIAIPRRVAINQVVPVTVNGAEVMVRWGANIAEAIRNSGEMRPEVVLNRLTVSRLYRGQPRPVEFDRGSPAILGLVLTGGEVISW